MNDNPKCLVVGAGPSFEDKLDYIRSFDGVVLVVEVRNKRLIEEGIVPDYIVTMEKDHGVLPQEFGEWLIPYRDRITVVHRDNPVRDLLCKFEGLELKTYEFDGRRLHCNNVGLYTVLFAVRVLESKEVHLVGMDHDGEIKGATNQQGRKLCDEWTAAFRRFVDKKPEDVRIINDSGRGRLYFNGIEGESEQET